LAALSIGGKEREAENSLVSLLAHLFNLVAEDMERVSEEMDCSSDGVLPRNMKSSSLLLLHVSGKPVKI